jgi:hypothetical protein
MGLKIPKYDDISVKKVRKNMEKCQKVAGLFPDAPILVHSVFILCHLPVVVDSVCLFFGFLLLITKSMSEYTSLKMDCRQLCCSYIQGSARSTNLNVLILH